MATIAEILSKKWPATIWTIRGDNYMQLIWHEENTIPKPTEEEIRAFDSEVSLELKWDKVKNQRNKLLSACDWTQLPDSPLSTEQKYSWAEYRQLLRDIPQNQTDPDNITWPSTP